MPRTSASSYHKIRITNFYLDRFINEVLSRPIPTEYYRLLSQRDRWNINKYRNEFLADASLDEKLLLLMRLGYPFAVVVGSPEASPMPLKKKFDMLQLWFKACDWKRDAVHLLRERFWFVLSDLQFLRSLQLASFTYNSPAITSFQGYSSVHKQVQQYQYEVQKKQVANQTSGYFIDEIISKSMAAATHEEDMFIKDFKINATQYIILATLSRFGIVGEKDMQLYAGRHKKYFTSLRGLIDQRYVDLTHIEKHKESNYFITGIGEQVLRVARNWIINRT